MKRYKQAADILMDNYRKGIISRDDTALALHGLGMELCIDGSVAQSDAIELIGYITKTICDLDVDDGTLDLFAMDAMARAEKLMT